MTVRTRGYGGLFAGFAGIVCTTMPIKMLTLTTAACHKIALDSSSAIFISEPTGEFIMLSANLSVVISAAQYIKIG